MSAAAAKISRPDGANRQRGNFLLFFAAPFTWLAWNWIPSTSAPWTSWIPAALFTLFAANTGIKGIHAFIEDHKMQNGWATALQPSSEEAESNDYATFEEMRAAGFYDGHGRILGVDLNGYLLFEPHKLRPTHSYIQAAAGGGKTTRSVISSTILSPLAQNR